MKDLLELAEDLCARKHGGHANSIAAFSRMKPSRRDRLEMILHLIRQATDGLTAKEVAAILGKPFNAVSGRLSELKAFGLVRESGSRRKDSAVLITTEVT